MTLKKIAKMSTKSQISNELSGMFNYTTYFLFKYLVTYNLKILNIVLTIKIILTSNLYVFREHRQCFRKKC